MMPQKRGADPFMEYLYSFRPGEVGDRQRWLAWAAMITLLAKASKPERLKWVRRFNELSQIEHNAAMTDAEQGQAFVDLLAPLWPKRARRGRPPDDNSGLLADFPVIHARLARSWKAGDAARAAAVAEVEKIVQGFNLGDHRSEILGTKSPRRAALLFLARAYDQDEADVRTQVETIETALRRALRRQNS